jgi:hypothetical protein
VAVLVGPTFQFGSMGKRSSETSIKFQQTTLRCIAEDSYSITAHVRNERRKFVARQFELCPVLVCIYCEVLIVSRPCVHLV